MIPEQIEHLGIAVPSIEAALPYYEGVLGMKCYKIEEVADQKVKTAFLKVGEVKIELLEPTCPLRRSLPRLRPRAYSLLTRLHVQALTA